MAPEAKYYCHIASFSTSVLVTYYNAYCLPHLSNKGWEKVFDTGSKDGLDVLVLHDVKGDASFSQPK